MTITGDRFLAGVKRRMTVPANQVLVPDSGILALGDDVMRDKLIPIMLSVNQNFFAFQDLDPLVASQAEYQIPYRAIGRGLRDLKIQQTGEASTRSNMVLVALEDEHLWAVEGTPSGFYFLGDKLVVVPRPTSATHQLVRWYDLQPNRIVKTTDAALVSSIAGDVVTCSSVPSTIVAGVTVDFIQGLAGCATRAMDVTVTNLAGTQLTFGVGAVPTTLRIGDYVALSQETPVIQLPDEAFPLLETLVSARLCYAIGDFDGQDRLLSYGKEQESGLKMILEPRVQGEPTKIINRNGLVRRRSFGRVRGGYFA